jgi:octaprenyl-diphosphate synthase
MTLPLIHTLQSLGKGKRRSLIRRIKRSADHPGEAESVLNEILAGSGMAYAEEKMRHHRDRAIALLQDLPDGEARRSLEALVDFTISRTK